nr:GNAT family N-acetyltransferase [Nocardioides flavescens]
MRTPDPGERQLLLEASADGRLLGVAELWVPLLDNTDKAWFELHVDPLARRAGVGTALVRRVEELARAEGRTLLLAETHLPADEREDHGHARFARACGYERASVEVVRHLDLPVPDERLQDWVDEAGAERRGYRVETHADGVPDSLVASLCVLLGQLSVDAPSGAVDFEEEVMTPERLTAAVASATAMGRTRLETVAISPDGEVVAQNTLLVPSRLDSTEVVQWGTFVHRAHRGRRLGLAVKAAGLRAAQRATPGARVVVTQNAEDNAFMVAINEQLGFRPVELTAEFARHLPA